MTTCTSVNGCMHDKFSSLEHLFYNTNVWCSLYTSDTTSTTFTGRFIWRTKLNYIRVKNDVLNDM